MTGKNKIVETKLKEISADIEDFKEAEKDLIKKLEEGGLAAIEYDDLSKLAKEALDALDRAPRTKEDWLRVLRRIEPE